MATSRKAVPRSGPQILLAQREIKIIAPDEQLEVFTPLGSCVSCIFFHPEIGAVLTHAKCPKSFGKHETGFYVDSSTEFAIQHFLQTEIPKKTWQVSLFGGGIIAPRFGKYTDIATIGWLNVIAALETLYEYRIALTGGNFAGFGGRKIHFFIDTGEVCLEKSRGLRQEMCVEDRTTAWLLLQEIQERLQAYRGISEINVM